MKRISKLNTSDYRTRDKEVARRGLLTPDRLRAEVEARPQRTAAETKKLSGPIPYTPMERLRLAITGIVTDLGFELTCRNLAILLHVYDEEAPIQIASEIGHKLKLHRSVMSRTAEKLHELQLIKKDTDPRNESRMYYHRTQRGQKLYDKLKGTIDDNEE
jgi:DNA-binding MarR family transcriptional regulator